MDMEKSEERRCAFFLERKKRYCRFKPVRDTKYCPEHAGILGVDQGRERIACPLNSKHYCYKDSLEKHLKKCRKQQKTLPVYYSQGINTDHESTDTSQEMKTPLKEFSTSELQDLIHKVHDLYDEHVKHIDEEILHHRCLNEELNNETFGIPAIRHRKQQASLVGQLENLHLLREGLCYVELGAGKGNLSHWIQQAQPDKTDLGFVLVDYGHVRYKADNKHKWPDTGPKFERLRIDIANLNLGKVESISSNQRPVVAVGKHLCGAATDLALRCITKTLRVKHSDESIQQPEQKKLKTEDEPSQRASLAGVTIALCCHHRCTWDSYVGKEFIQECGLAPRDFILLCKLSGWTAATWTGWKTKEEMIRETKEFSDSTGDQAETSKIAEKVTEDEPSVSPRHDSNGDQTETSNTAGIITETSTSVSPLEDKKIDGQQSIDSNDTQEHEDTGQLFSRNDLQLSPSQREEIGRKCKRLIDIGRVHYLRNCGLQSQLKTYIEEKLTPENVIIVANTVS